VIWGLLGPTDAGTKAGNNQTDDRRGGEELERFVKKKIISAKGRDSKGGVKGLPGVGVKLIGVGAWEIRMKGNRMGIPRKFQDGNSRGRSAGC